ncbi:MAG: hypothetical protein K2P19_11075 [Kineothrix sp.]|nr:hypothetical protein [Kineothrix sp.]
MLLDKKEGMRKKKKGGIVAGYDMNDEYAQISYSFLDKGQIETLAVVAGTEQYSIPMALCRKKETKQWLFGKEAVKCAKEGGGFLVEKLVGLAKDGEMVDVYGESFDPVALLALFIRRSLSLLNLIAPVEWLEGMMLTVDCLDGRMVEVLARIAVNLNLKTDRIFFQSHVESYYHYMLHQPEELWSQEVMLCDYDNRRLKIYGFGVNKRTTPMVAMISIDEYVEMARKGIGAGRDAGIGVGRETEKNAGIELGMETWKVVGNEEERKRLDEIFLGIVEKKCGGREVSCVYLIGDGYKDGWASRSLRYLCRGRRAFQGNNLYSKGACYGIKEKLGLDSTGGEYVFLGLDKLKANIGMHVLRQGKESYFAMMDAGANWFETKREFDIILEDGDGISLLFTPLDGKAPREVNMIMEGLKVRPGWTTRLRVAAEMVSEQQLRVMVKDMGFGEFFPASGGEWNKVFEI